MLSIVALALLAAGALRAQDLTGNWQGTLKALAIDHVEKPSAN